MNERDAFLRKILAAPDDDTPRLVFADWLDEHGEAERGEFIRVGCEWARLLPVLTEWSYDLSARVDALRSRELELLRSHSPAWMPAIPFRCIQFKEEGPTPSVAVGFASEQSLDSEFYFRRGFVESVACPWEVCRDHLDAVLACQPVRRVRPTTWVEIWMELLPRYPGLSGLRFGLEGRAQRINLGVDALRTWSALDIRLRLLAAEWPGVEFDLSSMTALLGGVEGGERAIPGR